MVRGFSDWTIQSGLGFKTMEILASGKGKMVCKFLLISQAMCVGCQGWKGNSDWRL